VEDWSRIFLHLFWLILLAGAGYLLYINGYLHLQMMRGLGIFVAKGKTYNNARFTACNGSIRRYLKFKENRKYIFTLDAKTSTGSVTVELLDSRKNIVFTLTDGDREGVLYPMSTT